MKRSPLWREFESGHGFMLWLLRFAILAGGALFLGFSAIVHLGWESQFLLGLVNLCIAISMNRGSRSQLVTITLVLLSIYSSVRYGYWRITTVITYFGDAGSTWTAIDAFFVGTLLLAEGYALLVLILGYVQSLWPLRRSPVPLPDDPKYWPAVDLLITTYDEPLSVVRFTALAAMNIDWPADKLHVYLLDDGGRKEFLAFAENAGIGYITRDDNRDAKAGNINNALAQLDSPFVAIFDCDHVPTRSFLQLTMGWLLRDGKLAVLQTPHHFYSPDPFLRNLDQFRDIPGEDELFYGVVQDGNDFWNATSFCGSCAVLRKTALDEVGGFAVETLTEDAHTSLRLQRRGWNTAYINVPQAAGLAPDRLSAHIRQRVRWARGMVQILRIENPLWVTGLTPAQRLCYFNAMLHFLFALPRLVFLLAPLVYLIFGMTSIPGEWTAIVAYAIPHLGLSSLTHSRMQGQHRHSFWNEIYETVLAPYVLLPTLVAFLSPASGRFNVTAKGGMVHRDYFDSRIARPFLLLLAFNLLGLCCAVARCVRMPNFDVPAWLSLLNWPASMYDPNHFGVLAVNVVWTVFNVAILGVAIAVARESQQRRQSMRVLMSVPSDIILADGSMIQGITSDLSVGGVNARVDSTFMAKPGESIRFVFPLLDGSETLPAIVVAVANGELRAKFESLSLQEDEALSMLLYSRANSWLGWGKTRDRDRPLRSLGRILRLSLRGLSITFAAGRLRRSSNDRLASGVAPLLLFAVLACLMSRAVGAAQVESAGTPLGPSGKILHRASAEATAPGSFDSIFTLKDAGAAVPVVLRGMDSSRSISFTVPRNVLVKTATMQLRYALSPALLTGTSHLNVSLNGTLIATLSPKGASAAGQSPILLANITIPSELLVHDNQLTFQFIGHYAALCEDPSYSALWGRIDPNSTIELQGLKLPLAHDLNLLPVPFYDPGVDPQSTVPIAFLSQPSAKAMQAAGIIASWLGILNSSRHVRFPVTIGDVPEGNAIVIAESRSQNPLPIASSTNSGATVSMGANPSDPYSNVLLIAGDNGTEVLLAAQALVLHGDTWQGPEVPIHGLTLPPLRQADDAPRWLSTEKGRAADVGTIEGGADLQGDGSAALEFPLHTPPDLDFGDRRNLPFRLDYRYNATPLGSGSALQVYMNGAFVSATPMPHTDQASPVLETVVPIPVTDLRPYANLLSLKFFFQIANPSHCENSLPAVLQGAVLKDSSFDITGIPHSAVLPNLQLFANAGFPFTRKADLDGTIVLLPNQPSAAELEMFLTLMGHFGAQTGYPVLRVAVADAAGMTRDGSHDYLVLGTATDQPALKVLDASLPVGVDSAGLDVRDAGGVFDGASWWKAGHTGKTQPGEITTGGGLPDALLEAMEWPAASRRSAVAIILRDDAAAPAFLSAFLNNSQSSAIADSVSVLHGNQFSSYRIGKNLYRLGDTSTVQSAGAMLKQFPWLIALLTILLCFLMAVPIQAMLRRHARSRLQGAD